MRHLIFLIHLLFFFTTFAQSGYQLSSKKTTLTFSKNKNGYSLSFFLKKTPIYSQEKPAIIAVITKDGHRKIYKKAYNEVKNENDKGYICQAEIETMGGAVFKITDVFTKSKNDDIYEVSRIVKVIHEGTNEIGFSSCFTLKTFQESAISDFDFFVPSIWYKDNRYVSKKALASNMTDSLFWFREDRMPLPIFMLRNKKDGTTFSIFHKNADGSTFAGEDGTKTIVDDRMQFAALGMTHYKQTSVGLWYPGTEGERTGIFGMTLKKKTANRFHPLQKKITQKYTVAFSLTSTSDFPSALQTTWQKYYTLEKPKLYAVDLEKVVNGQIGILNHYWKEINNTAGFPFRIKLNGVLESKFDYNYNMGFVGQQTGNAAMLIRQGFKLKDTVLRNKGEKVIKFWVENAIMPSGIPRTWFDPYPQTWRENYPTHLRVLGDGMHGIMLAYSYEKKNGIAKPKWLRACEKVANWLQSVQNEDGSFYQQYNFNTGKIVSDSKNNTSNVIPFLADLYLATHRHSYLKIALKAGDFIYEDTHKKYKYAGGVADNPNIMDKESASMALRAFLALYDIDKNKKWLDAAKQAAFYYQTWVFSWDVPIPKNDKNAIFPYFRNVTGLSQIATGNNAADVYAAIDAFNFYRLYLYTNDAQLLYFAKMLYRNTKQYINWDAKNPIPNMAKNFMGEAVTVVVPRGHGVTYFLPWESYTMLAPLFLLQDTFHSVSYDVEEVEKLNKTLKDSLHDKYAKTGGLN
ncbi:hypothetical protein ACG2LH_12210 [Zhouia sp. PK063]|uniref:hypothetical protein n=1 Tax=Zhouia sp. PK063 TaxID=3373602 RepID=UPI0037AF0C38